MRVKTILVVSFIAAGFAGSAFSEDAPKKLEGDWQGTLKAGPAELRLVLHLAKDAAGGFTGTLDSIDQGANGMAVGSIVLKGSNVSFSVESVNGAYEGTLNSDSTEMKGTWSQDQPLPLDFKRGTTPLKTEHKPAAPSDIDGGWMGTLDTGSAKLRLLFHIHNTEDGLVVTMDSLDQDKKGIPATAASRDGASLKVEMKQLAGGFQGTIDKDRTTIDGQWTQGGGTLPLVLKRAKE